MASVCVSAIGEQPDTANRKRVPDHLQQLAANLRAARDAAGISQRRLSELSGVDLAHVNRIEAARRDPSTRVLVRLARALRTTAAELLRDID